MLPVPVAVCPGAKFVNATGPETDIPRVDATVPATGCVSARAVTDPPTMPAAATMATKIFEIRLTGTSSKRLLPVSAAQQESFIRV